MLRTSPIFALYKIFSVPPNADTTFMLKASSEKPYKRNLSGVRRPCWAADSRLDRQPQWLVAADESS